MTQHLGIPNTITFKKNTLDNKIQRLLDQETISFLDQNTWILDKNQWRQKRSIRKLFPVAQSIQVQILWLSQNYKEDLLKQLHDVAFPSLKKLFLFNNNIQSIQALCKISFPGLKELYLRDNHISSIVPLRRLYMPQVQWIKLNNNFISQFDCLQQMKCPDSCGMLTDYFDAKTHEQRSIKWIFKIESMTSKTLKFNPNQGIFRMQKHKFLQKLAQIF